MSSMQTLNDLTSHQLKERRERVFIILAGIFLGTLAMLNILGISRFIVLASWGADGLTFGEAIFDERTWIFATAVGVLPYPMTFLCTDLISEFFGRRRANFVVFVGLILNIWVMLILWVGGVLPGFEDINPSTGLPVLDEADRLPVFFEVRTLAFGAVTASMIAYLVAQFVDVQLFHFWKRLTRGRWLWIRNNGSTIVSQFVDTFAVITITHFYANALPISSELPLWPQLWMFIATGYAFKLAIALIDTPIIYAAVWWLKGYLRIDPTQMHDDVNEIALLAEDEKNSSQT